MPCRRSARCSSSQPGEAKIGLNACLQREPEFAWLYFLRGFASEIAASPRAVEKTLKSAKDGRGRATSSRPPRPITARRWSFWSRSRTTSCATSSSSIAGCSGSAAPGSRRGGGGLAGGDPAQRAAIRGVRRAGAGLPEAGKADEAVEQFSRAIAAEPDWAALYRGRADVDLARTPTPAQRARALRDLEQAIRLEEPGNPVLARDHTNRGRLLHRDHREAEALAACEAALKVVPDYDEPTACESTAAPA